MGIPRAQLEGTLISRLTMLAVGTSLLFAAGLLLAWLTGGRIARSISSLTASAIALGRGERPPASDTKVKEATEVESAIQSASELLRERALALEAGQEELRNAHRLARFGTWHWNAGTGEIQVSPSIPYIYGRDVPSFPDQRGTLLTEESWERLNAEVQEALRSGKGYDLELEVNHGDGHRIWIYAKSEVVLNERNEVIALRGTIQDITERKRYEDALRESEAAARRAAYQAEAERLRLATVLEATPVAVIVCDAEGGILQSNAASKALWGESHPQTRGVAEYSDWKGWWADGSERHGRPVLPHEWPIARALRGEEATADIIEIAPFDDPARRRIVTVSCALIRNGQGQVLGGVVVQMDITDRVRAEQELRDAARRKDEFLAMLAHELRNPLAPVAAAADLLQLGASDATRVQQVSAVIARQVRHMAGLIDDLLDVSRVTRGLIALEKQPVDVNRIVADAAEQARPLIEAKRHALSLHAPQQPVSVLGDAKRLVQIIVNLLTNAAKFTPEGGKIDVDVGLSGDWVEIAVRDNGIGMNTEVRERAFDMFAQGERAPDRSQGGLGIGLALVKSLVELHGGRVVCDSAGPGMGSRFIVTLPRADSLPAEATRAAVDRPHDAPKALKVMVVDDNVDAARMLASLVETLGHEAVVEYGSHAALKRGRVEQPALCFLDIGLPEMDGKELARLLRAQPETAHAMLVAITGYAQEQDRQSIKQAGFDHHFAKPIDMTQVAAILSEAGRQAAE
jgi:signal transduction histidine kinase/ActR/RegA family two-component response regulator